MDFLTIWSAVNYANRRYSNTRDAADSKIEAAEQWVNDNATKHRADVVTALDGGDLHRSPTSGRLFIRLKQRG